MRGEGGGAAHAEALDREIAVLAKHANQRVRVNVDETHEAVAAASARHVGVDRNQRVDALGVAGESEG